MKRHRRNPDDEEDEVVETILAAAREAITDLAEAQAAQAWSTVDDMTADEYDDVFIVAEFGYYLAVNGDLVFKDGDPQKGFGGWKDIEIPKGFRETNKGGDIPGTEEEVQNDFIADWVIAHKKDFNLDGVSDKKIEEVISKNLRPYEYTSVSGESTIYVKGKKK
jgi:hypothetical protein